MPGKYRNLLIQDINLFSDEQLELLENINKDKHYTDPLSPEDDPKYRTSLERFINRALSNKCTMQDILNLGVMAAKMKKIHSMGKHTELGADFYGSISVFCNEITGLEKEKYIFQYFTTADFFQAKPGYKKKSIMTLSPDGYVRLTDEQKQRLLYFREQLINTKQYSEGYGDAGLIRNEYKTFTYEAGSAQKININDPSLEESYIDRKAEAAALTSFYALNNPTINVSNAPKSNAAIDQMARLKIDKLTAADSRIAEIREAWSAMKSHTPHISLFNSTEFNNMEKAYKAYITAYDNLKAGMTIDGKNYRMQKDYLEHDDLVKLKKLQDDMQTAARAYTDAKRAQKGGGIDKHYTGQGKDRLAMADALAELDIFPKAASRTSDNNVKSVKLSDIDDSANRGRSKLNKHIQKLESKEMTNIPQKKL